MLLSFPVTSSSQAVRVIPSQSSAQGAPHAAVVESSVVAAFRRGDPAAVAAFYRRYGRRVYGVAYRVLGQVELAEEATQQAFVRAWQAADRLDPDRDPEPWLVTIAKRVAIDMHRRATRRPATSLDEMTTDHPALVSLPADIASIEAVWHVRRAIDTLPPNEAVIVRMQHLCGRTHTEIAAKLGVALGTVKSRSARAHRKLAKLLCHLQEPPDS